MIYKPFSTNKYLNYCAEIEKCALLMYEHFANNESDTSLSLLWQKLAEEEKQHVEQIELLRRASCVLKCENNRIDDQEIQQRAINAQDSLDKAYHLPYDPYFACNLSVRLESNFFELHSRRCIVSTNIGLLHLFQNLAGDDTGHISRIQSLCSAYFSKEIDMSTHKHIDSFLA